VAKYYVFLVIIIRLFLTRGTADWVYGLKDEAWSPSVEKVPTQGVPKGLGMNKIGSHRGVSGTIGRLDRWGLFRRRSKLGRTDLSAGHGRHIVGERAMAAGGSLWLSNHSWSNHSCCAIVFDAIPGLNWIRLNWIEFDWIGLNSIELDWIGLSCRIFALSRYSWGALWWCRTDEWIFRWKLKLKLKLKLNGCWVLWARSRFTNVILS